MREHQSLSWNSNAIWTLLSSSFLHLSFHLGFKAVLPDSFISAAHTNHGSRVSRSCALLYQRVNYHITPSLPVLSHYHALWEIISCLQKERLYEWASLLYDCVPELKTQYTVKHVMLHYTTGQSWLCLVGRWGLIFNNCGGVIEFTRILEQWEMHWNPLRPFTGQQGRISMPEQVIMSGTAHMPILEGEKKDNRYVKNNMFVTVGCFVWVHLLD